MVHQLVCIVIVVKQIFEPSVDEIAQLAEDWRACHKLIQICIKLSSGGRLYLVVQSIIFFFTLVLSGHVSCFLEFFEKLGHNDCIESEVSQIDLDRVASIEAGDANLRIFYFFLEV